MINWFQHNKFVPLYLLSVPLGEIGNPSWIATRLKALLQCEMFRVLATL